MLNLTALKNHIYPFLPDHAAARTALIFSMPAVSVAALIRKSGRSSAKVARKKRSNPEARNSSEMNCKHLTEVRR
jgi:hypothetical protein